MTTIFKKLALALLLSMFSLANLNLAFAQDDDDDSDDGPSISELDRESVNHLVRSEPSTRLEPLGFGLMGDSIDPFTGTLVFNQTDVSIPGNSSLEVAIRRTASTQHMTNAEEGLFGDWILDVPNISSLSTAGVGGYFNCADVINDEFSASAFTRGGSHTDLSAAAYWDGMNLNIPGQGSKKLLEGETINFRTSFPEQIWRPFSEAVTIHDHDGLARVTKDHWVVTCINPDFNGPGQNNFEGAILFDGYIAISPTGTRYRMDKKVVMVADEYKTNTTGSDGGNGDFYLARDLGKYYATEVTDVHGNWVRYDYSDDGKLLRIYSNDDREITLDYLPGTRMISEITANGRTWEYSYQDVERTSYTGKVLHRVTQPDGKYWEFDLEYLTLGRPSSVSYNDSFYNGGPRPLNNTVKHPYGVSADYKFGIIRHSATATRVSAVYTKTSYSRTYSVLSKTLSGPSIPNSVWRYDYEQWENSTAGSYSSTSMKTTTVTDPLGRRAVKHYVRSAESSSSDPTVGLLKKEERFSIDGSLLEEIEYEHVIGPRLGTSSLLFENFKLFFNTYPSKTITHRNGDTYTQEYSYNLDLDSADYSYGKPVSVKNYSNVSTIPRESVVTFTHKKNHWILNLTDALETEGREVVRYTYNSLGQETSETRYGERVASYTYHTSGDQAGRLSSVRDGNNNTSYLHNYYRGQAQNIERPDGSQDVLSLDANGWVAAMTGFRGFTTSYEHDIMGRLTKIIPSKTQKNWADTLIDYTFGNDVVQTITRGDSQETVTYDNLFRSVEEEKYDLLTGNSIYTAMEYNAAGEKIFQSFPSAYGNPTDGMDYTYDGLGRKASVQENVTPFATTSYNYLNNHGYEVTDPSGASTRYYYSGYNSSGKTELLRIEQPLDVSTTITRNIWGERTELTQSGTQNGVSMSETQKFYYNDQRRLCAYYTPEGGHTRYAYDSGGRMTAYQPGATSGSTCQAPTGSDMVTLSYDELDRVTLTNFADNDTPDISKTYDTNGNVLTANRNGINWSYGYDELNKLTSEQLDIDGRNFDLAYEYDTSGFMISRTLPSGRKVDYEYDGLGRATNVESGGEDYASSMSYHANNLIEGMTYGNGQVFTQTLNSRLQPESLYSQSGSNTAIDLNYSYDERGDITSIIDGTDSSNNKTLGYDELGRLIQADSSWGQGSFEYDALGNLRRKQLGSRLVTVSYDANNRATQSTDTAGSTRQISYDNRGNVTTLGGLSFVYDKAQQPVQLSGSSSGSYQYDGNLKRVKVAVDGKTIYNVYDASGSLVYVEALDDAVLDVCFSSCQNVVIPKVTDYIKAGGMTIARISNGNPTYLHPDHLGSPVAGTDALGNVDWKENFTPFGEKLVGDAANDDLGGYTGHISDSATGLTYMQARYYDPVIGRFLSIDPVGFMVSKPYMFNRYAYVGNNPIGRTDPFGMDDADINQNEPEDEPEDEPEIPDNIEEIVVTASRSDVGRPKDGLDRLEDYFRDQDPAMEFFDQNSPEGQAYTRSLIKVPGVFDFVKAGNEINTKELGGNAMKNISGVKMKAGAISSGPLTAGQMVVILSGINALRDVNYGAQQNSIMTTSEMITEGVGAM